MDVNGNSQKAAAAVTAASVLKNLYQFTDCREDKVLWSVYAPTQKDALRILSQQKSVGTYLVTKRVNQLRSKYRGIQIMKSARLNRVTQSTAEDRTDETLKALDQSIKGLSVAFSDCSAAQDDDEETELDIISGLLGPKGVSRMQGNLKPSVLSKYITEADADACKDRGLKLVSLLVDRIPEMRLVALEEWIDDEVHFNLEVAEISLANVFY